jgi:hypothetical protein
MTAGPAHARFHGVVALTMTSTLASLNLWSLWSDATDRLFAAAASVGYWAPFLVAPLVPGAGVDDPPHPIPRVAGVPTSLLGAAATTLTAVAGLAAGSTHPLIPRNHPRFWPAGAIAGNEHRAVTAHPRLPFLA